MLGLLRILWHPSPLAGPWLGVGPAVAVPVLPRHPRLGDSPADLSFDPAFLMCAFDSGLAVERFQPQM